MALLLWVGAVRAATVGPGGDYETLAEALADTNLRPAVLDLAPGRYVGPFQAYWPLTLRGGGEATLTASFNATGNWAVLTATNRLTLEGLVLDGDENKVGLLAFSNADLTLTDVVLEHGGHDGVACVHAENAGKIEMTRTVMRDCRHGDHFGMYISNGTEEVDLVDVTFEDNDVPALVVLSADTTLDGVVVVDNDINGLLAAAVQVLNADLVRVDRSWFCGNDGGALSITSGCGNDCEIEYSVFTDNGTSDPDRGALTARMLDEPLRVDHATFIGNSGPYGGHIYAYPSATIEVDRTLFVTEGGDVVSLPGVTVEDSAFFPSDPVGGNQVLQEAPQFVAGYVPPACGRGVTLDPGSSPTGPFDWRGPDAIGALTTPECGPWCADADGDALPAMWDCNDDDPTIGVDCAVVDPEPPPPPPPPCWVDDDNDGFGVPRPGDGPCAPGEVQLDCDDTDPRVTAGPCALQLTGGRCSTGPSHPTGAAAAWLALWWFRRRPRAA